MKQLQPKLMNIMNKERKKKKKKKKKKSFFLETKFQAINASKKCPCYSFLAYHKFWGSPEKEIQFTYPYILTGLDKDCFLLSVVLCHPVQSVICY